MKIVINKCYGGFSLSPKAEKRYLELKGKTPYFYVQTKYNFQDGIEEYQRKDLNEAKEAFLCHVLLKDIGKTVNKLTYEDDEYFSSRDIKRNDLDLVKVIEELRAEASGSHAELAIVEIPDGVEYEIDEYDGIEHVAEKHRTWS